MHSSSKSVQIAHKIHMILSTFEKKRRKKKKTKHTDFIYRIYMEAVEAIYKAKNISSS